MQLLSDVVEQTNHLKESLKEAFFTCWRVGLDQWVEEQKAEA